MHKGNAILSTFMPKALYLVFQNSSQQAFFAKNPQI